MHVGLWSSAVLNLASALATFGAADQTRIFVQLMSWMTTFWCLNEISSFQEVVKPCKADGVRVCPDHRTDSAQGCNDYTLCT